jgi:hypothetical protein
MRMTYSNIFEHEGINFEQWFAVLFNNKTVRNKGKNTRLALIRRQNARLIERIAARIKRITDDPVIEESCNATQQPLRYQRRICTPKFNTMI